MSSPAHSYTSEVPSALSSSPLLAVRQAPGAGRGAYATERIPAGTHLHTAPSPAAYVINREYRREVCGECFAYDRSVAWKLRDSSTGTAWCSVECEVAWRVRYGQIEGDVDVMEAMAVVERLIRKARAWNNGGLDTAMLDIAEMKPEQEEIQQAWIVAEQGVGRLIYGRRTSEEPRAKVTAKSTKAERKVMTSALAIPPAPDILSYLLSAVLTARGSPETWNDLLNLHSASRAYASHSALNQHISAYHQLLAIVPVSLLPYIQPEVLTAASTRDAHNSFGLRSLDDGGSEMFGFGVWPSASYWNHSCAPNVSKKRVGRAWHFETSRDVDEGEELCITYLGGEERDLGFEERKKRLHDIWEFDCACLKCVDEATQVQRLS